MNFRFLMIAGVVMLTGTNESCIAEGGSALAPAKDGDAVAFTVIKDPGDRRAETTAFTIIKDPGDRRAEKTAFTIIKDPGDRRVG